MIRLKRSILINKLHALQFLLILKGRHLEAVCRVQFPLLNFLWSCCLLLYKNILEDFPEQRHQYSTTVSYGISEVLLKIIFQRHGRREGTSSIQEFLNVWPPYRPASSKKTGNFASKC
jgi:hypothetical protein